MGSLDEVQMINVKVFPEDQKYTEMLSGYKYSNVISSQCREIIFFLLQETTIKETVMLTCFTLE